jgi:VWFA-related protein
MFRGYLTSSIAGLLAVLSVGMVAHAQQPSPTQRVRTVTIPISIFTKKELKGKQTEEYIQAENLLVREDSEDQQILSIKSVGDSPLSIALLMQDDLTAGFNLQIKDIQEFIRGLPRGTRVLVAYLRNGSPQITQKFTDDLDRAASSLRIVAGSQMLAPRDPYDGVSEILSKFDAMPAGRRAILLFSDGLDVSQGLSLASITQSFDLDQAILKAQRKSVAVYSFYAPTVFTESTGSTLAFAAQGALQKLSDATGGRSFGSGSFAPVSYIPHFRDLLLNLNRQFSLTYLSTHMKKGYHKVEVRSTNPEIKIEHPNGYYYR